MEERHGLKHEAWEFIKIIVVSLAIVIPIRMFVVQPFVVRGASMEPNFLQGEYLVINELLYYFKTPARGDVIVFRYPQNKSQFFIKRIVGLPGETVEIKGGNVFVAEEGLALRALNEPYLADNIVTVPDTKVVLNSEEYFVLGDNRPQSSDSRIWGLLNREFIIGKAWLRLWPVAHAEVLP